MKNDTSFYEKQAVVYEEEDASVFHCFIIISLKGIIHGYSCLSFLGENQLYLQIVSFRWQNDWVLDGFVMILHIFFGFVQGRYFLCR